MPHIIDLPKSLSLPQLRSTKGHIENVKLPHLTTIHGLEAGVIELIERLRLEERAGVRLLHVVQVTVRQRRVGQSDTRTRR